MSATSLAACLVWASAAVAQTTEPAVLLSRARQKTIIQKPEEARALYQQALQLYVQRKDQAGQATVHVHLSDLAVRNGDLAAGIESRKTAYGLFRQASKGYSQALTLRELALLYLATQDKPRARNMLERSLAMFDFLDAEDDANLTRAALLAVLVGDTTLDVSGIVQHSRALIGSARVQSQPELLAGAYDSLGYASMCLGDHATALSCYDTALELLQRAQAEAPLRESVQNNQALAMLYLGQAQAAANAHEALAHARSKRNDTERAVNSWTNASLAWRYAHDLDRAQRALQETEQLLGSRPLPVSQAVGLEIHRGRLNHERGDYVAACRHYRRGLDMAAGVPQDLWRLRYFFALSLDRLGQPRAAQQQLEESLAHVERMRGDVWEFRHRASYCESRGDVFGLLIELLMREGRSREAFDVVERHKARVFLDLIGSPPNARRELPAHGAPTVETTRDDLAQVLPADDERTRGLIVSLKAGAKQQPRPEPALARDAAAADDPLPSSQRARSLAQIQAALLKSEGLLEFYFGRERGYAFLLTSDAFDAWPIDLTRDRLGQLVRQWRHEIETTRAEPLSAARTAAETALYDQLVAPLRERLTDGAVSLLYIVSDGPLHYLPLPALRDAQGGRLLDGLAVAQVPSASSLVVLSELPAKAAPRSLLSIANPANDLPALPAALREAQGVQQSYSQSRVLSGAQATKAAVLEALDKYDILHFALHGRMNAQRPTDSALILAGKSDHAEAQLTVREIAQLRLPASLAILSACESGLVAGRTTDTPRGDDVEGLSRAFLLAGVPCVVGTLWQVSDESTADLIGQFVTNRQQSHLNPAAALALAQREMARQPRRQHPFYWSGVSVWGLAR